MINTKTIPTPFAQRLQRARVSLIPLVVWLSSAFLASRLWLAQPAVSTYFGLAHAAELRVLSPVDGEITGLSVGLFQRVSSGQILATIGSRDIDARIATARAELDRLGAELNAQRAELELESRLSEWEAAQDLISATSIASLEFPAEIRAFHSDESGIELKLLETHLDITSSELEANRLAVRLRRTEALASESLKPAADVEDLDSRLAKERARTHDLQQLELGLKRELVEARSLREEVVGNYQSPSMNLAVDPAIDERLAGFVGAVAVQQRKLDELVVLQKSYVIRAPKAGQVASLSASEGEFVLAGTPILVLSDSVTSKVAMWVPEFTPGFINLGDRLAVTRAAEGVSAEPIECFVESLSPRLEVIPNRLWRDIKVPEYGRNCLLAASTSLMLLPGELVSIDPASHEDED